MRVFAITLSLAAIAAVIPATNGPLGAALGCANAYADSSLTSPYPMHPEETFATWVRKRNALEDLRAEIIKLQAQDGGRLTPAHHQYLQVKYNAIMAGNY